jgi:hypothetical protein
MKNTLQIGKFYNIDGRALRLESIDRLNRHDFTDGGRGTGRRLDPSRERDLRVLENLVSVKGDHEKIARREKACNAEMVSLGYGI